MTKRNVARGFGEFFGMLGSAIAVSSAMREHRRANDADLVRLGLDPEQFRTLRRF